MRSSLFSGLLECGRTAEFVRINKLPGAGVHHEVLRLADRDFWDLLKFFESLEQEDRIALLKAIAVYEHSVGGLGSVTTLHRLLPLVEDSDRSVLDWILKNTRSYWYYGKNARSVTELDQIISINDSRRRENLAKEKERETSAKKLKAQKAGNNLANAIKRRDLKAFNNLLLTIHEYAVILGRDRFAYKLDRAIRDDSD